MKIGVVNNSLGNVGSVLSAFDFYKCRVSLVGSPDELRAADALVLAGVGNFRTAVSRLRALHLWDALQEAVMVRKKPVLGICLGMQLFAEVSYEDGENRGFGWIPGQVVRIAAEGLRVPHTGWNEVRPRDAQLFQGMRYHSFYFMHSYHFIPADPGVIKAVTPYGPVEIVSAVGQENILGVQFHPEKSQGDGLRLLRNFMEMWA